MSVPAQPATKQSFIQRRPMVVAALIVLLIVVVVGGGIVIVANPFGAKAPAATEQTIWQAIAGKIRDGRPSKQTALEAFAYAYDIEIPAVEVPSGVDGDDVPTSGTGVSSWVRANWDQLSPEQQAVISPYLEQGPNDTVITLDLSAPTGTTSSRRMASTQALEETSAAVDAPDDALQKAFRLELLAGIAHIGQRLGMPPISDEVGFFPWSHVTLDFSEEDGGNTAFQTHAISWNGIYTPCNIIVYRNTWQGQQANGEQLPEVLHVQLLHEVVHCYQNVIWGSITISNSMPPWITEGTALWLAADDTKLIEPMVPSQWRNGYFRYPERALTNRGYDAYGYYALLDHLGRNLWSLMVPAWKAAAAAATPGSNSSNAFIGILNGDASDVREAWAPSYLRRNAWGDPWIAYGFGLPDDAQVVPHAIGAYPSPGFLGELDSRSNAVTEVQELAGEIVIIQTDGLANAHDNANHSKLAFQSARFCVEGDCVCPTDTPRAGQHMADEQMALPFVLAINAPSGGAKYRVIGRKLRDECGERQEEGAWPPPNQGTGDPPCGTGCAGSNGDPHLRTVDNVYYDFQAAGEFVLLRSADASLEVQARQEPYLDSDNVSINTAVAARNNGHRVGIYSDGDALVARVDGAVVDASVPIDLGNGARIAQFERGYQVDFPDGTQLWALSVGEWGIEAQVRPSEGLRREGVGILGPVVPGGLGVPKLPDGTRLPRAADAQQEFQMIYGTFADAWRVTDRNTLFDYDAGRSTASYTDKAFPTEQSAFTPADLTDEQRAAAAGPCAEITDLGLLEQCLFDVSVTGEPDFATVYSMVQDLVRVGPDTLGLPIDGGPGPSPTPGVPSTPGPTGTPVEVPANAVLTGLESLLGSAVGPDGTVYLSVAYPDAVYKLVAVDPLSGEVVNEVDAEGGGQVAVAAGSVWVGEFTADMDCSTTRLDASTLAVQATIATPCDQFGTTLASTGDAVWYLDRSVNDYQAEGVRRIDPATNAPDADAVVLPFFNGFLYGSASGLVYGDPGDAGWYRVPIGQSEPVALGARGAPVYLGGDGIWTQVELEAQLFTSDGAAAAVIPIDGPLVGADDLAVYVSQISTVDSSDELWSYPVSGADPVRLATAPSPYGDRTFSYFDNDPLLIGSGGLVKLWVAQTTPTSESALFAQWIPAP